MKVKGVIWLGTRTSSFEAMVNLYRNIMGLILILVKVFYLILPNLPQIGGSLDGILFDLAFAGFGYSLWMDRRTAPQRATAAALT